MPGHRKLGRKTAHRKSMLRGMVTYLVEHGRIETTVTRAKEVSSLADRMVSVAKNEDLHSKRKVYNFLTKNDVAKKLLDTAQETYKERNSGFTRIIKVGPRRGDGAEMALIELIDHSINEK